MEEHGIQPIDLVCVNLYPFEQTVAKAGVSFEEAIENIDIGGPSMIRAAAKNHRYVLVVTSPDRYEKVLGDLREHAGASCGKHRLKQAQRAFALTARYDAAIAGYLAGVVEPRKADTGLPETISLNLRRKQTLRYGENPHQNAALYVTDRPAGLRWRLPSSCTARNSVTSICSMRTLRWQRRGNFPGRVLVSSNMQRRAVSPRRRTCRRQL